MSPTPALSAVQKRNALYTALLSGAGDKLDAALNNAPDLNADNGRALRLCAEKNDYTAAKKLMRAGADVFYALLCHQKQMAHDKSAEAQNILTNLRQYRSLYKTEIQPDEQTRLLREILARQNRLEKQVDDFKAALAEITAPPDLDKPDLKAPRISPKTTPPPAAKENKP